MTLITARTDLAAVAARYATDPAAWPVAPRFSARGRWYHRLATAADHEVWLLTWLPGQGTDLHDHGGSAGAFRVVSGTLTEETVLPGTPARLAARDLAAGAARRFGARHVHRVVNRSGRPAVSVHAYGPALAAMTRYRLTAGRLEVQAVETAGVQW